MKGRAMVILVVLLISVLACSGAVYAGAPADGFDANDGIYVKAEKAYYPTGAYSSGYGYVDYLCLYLTGATSLDDAANYQVNYAVGGAMSGNMLAGYGDGTGYRSNWSTWLTGWGFNEQVNYYLSNDCIKGQIADTDKKLFIVDTGGNDSYAASTLGTEGAVALSVNYTKQILDTLVAAGARHIVVNANTVKPSDNGISPGFITTHRPVLATMIEEYQRNLADAGSDVQLILFDMQPLFDDMRTQGPEAYGMKSFLFSLISDWVPAYGYAWVKDDNSSLLPTSPVEDIYGYGYTYQYNDGYYSRPDEASYDTEDYLFYDEYHLSEIGQQWRAVYMLGRDVGAAECSVYQGKEISSVVTSGIADMTFDKIVVFGASGSDTGQANKVTKGLVANRAVKHIGITDMDDCTNSWYATYVNYALQKDMMKGISATTFAPNVNMTRAQFVTALARANDVPDSSAMAPAELVFPDVDVTKYYANAVAWAVGAGIADGISTTQFAPNAYITKQDMAKMMVKFANFANINIGLTDGSTVPIFLDSTSIATYAQASVNQLAEAGILVGVNGKFNPKSNVTRAEATKVLVELLN